MKIKKMLKRRTKSLLEIHLAVLLFGIAGLFGKLIMLPPAIIVLGRVFFAAITVFIMLEEIPTIRTILGGLVILVASLYATVKK